MANTNEVKKTCFIVTPIGGAGSLIRRKIDGVIDEVIEPVLSELGFEMFVSHRINDSGSVTNTIIKKVYESDLVIANLTGNNPNVMYEVAIRHASAKPIIHITENISELPFDINDQRTIEYTDDMAGAMQLKKDLKGMINGIDYDKSALNPVTIALEKKNLVNIPKDATKDFSEILFQLQDDMRNIKDQMSVLNAKSYLDNQKRRIYDYFMELEEDKIKENLSDSDRNYIYLKNYLNNFSKDKIEKEDD